MKAWKFIVLVGGICGLIGFFLPFLKATYPDGKTQASFSAFEFVKGVGDITKEMPKEIADAANHEQLQKWQKELNDVLQSAAGYVVMFFAPAILVLIIGAIGVARGRFGRLGGIFAFLAGGASAGVWALFQAVIAEDKGTGGPPVGMGFGLHMLLIAGLCGIVAGLGALIKPDRGEAMTTRVA